MKNFVHVPVLLNEVLTALAVKPDGFYIDATFGRGGHAQAILGQLGSQGRLLVLDRDPQAIKLAKELLGEDERCFIVHRSFSHLAEVMKEVSPERQADGLLLDLGVSSPQLDDALRGFSFQQDGPLDMRMNPLQGRSIAEWLATATAGEIADVLWTYGEERYAKRIANAIVQARQGAPITRTLQLAAIVVKANPRWEQHKHPATRSFLAMRSFINSEVAELTAVLASSRSVLKVGGRLVVVSFHSLEDKMVKQFLQRQAQRQDIPKEVPLLATELKPFMRILSKAIRATEEEIQQNPRARSAILRVGEVLQ